MFTRWTLLALVVSVGLIGQVPARSADANAVPNAPTYIVRVAGGIVYYYDLAGRPLFYDDFVHYAYPHRFVYQNGGWVLVTHRYSYCRYSGYVVRPVPAANSYRSGAQTLQKPLNSRPVNPRAAVHPRPARVRTR